MASLSLTTQLLNSKCVSSQLSLKPRASLACSIRQIPKAISAVLTDLEMVLRFVLQFGP
jgi:hypothetical protein